MQLIYWRHQCALCPVSLKGQPSYIGMAVDMVTALQDIQPFRCSIVPVFQGVSHQMLVMLCVHSPKSAV